MQTPSLFGHSPQLSELQARVRAFVEAEAIPLERPEMAQDVQAIDAVARVLREKAQHAGIHAPQLPVELGGLGLSWRDRAVVLEEAGRSFLGPIAMHCAPPDEPNMINLMTLGSPQQKVSVADRAAQMMGALGMSHDSPVSMILCELRSFRIYDGLHRATLARRILKFGLRA